MAGVFGSLKTLVALGFAALFGYIFVFSGVVVTILSLLLLVLWPFSKTAYRYITSALAYTVLGQIVWLCTDYADLRVHIFASKETMDKFGRESQIITSSHRGNLDWISGFVLGAHYRFLHTVRSLPKKSVKYIPGFGQLLWALEYPFLERNNFQKDKEAIRAMAKVYKSYPFPVQVAIYCEGSRFSKEKYLKGVEYAKSHDLPPLKHHLAPRTKGFALLAEYLRKGGGLKSVIDVGVAYPNTDRDYSHLDLLLGRKMDIYWYLRRIPIEELPESHEELNTFCHQMFQHKDEAYQHFLQKGVFPAPRQPLPPFQGILWRLRVIVTTWCLLLTVLPLLVTFLTLSWSAFTTLLTTFCLVNCVMFVALLIYGGQGKGARDDNHATIDTAKKDK